MAVILSWLAQRGGTQVHVGLEATSTYGGARARHYRERGPPVSRVNPTRIKVWDRFKPSRL